MRKSELRKIARTKRDLIPKCIRDTVSFSIARYLFPWIKSKAYLNIALYHEIGSEISTKYLHDMMFSPYLPIYPKVMEDGLVFGIERQRDNLVMSESGIPEPIHTSFPLDKIEAIIIPGLAFDYNGNRLGYGAGYYDKALANFFGIKIGICFDEQLVEEVPVEPHDSTMNVIITESKFIHLY